VVRSVFLIKTKKNSHYKHNEYNLKKKKLSQT